MWYEKRYNPSLQCWCVYECSSTRCVLVRTFKTEKATDNYIRKHHG